MTRRYTIPQPRAMKVECPICFASPGDKCWSVSLGCELPEYHVHDERKRAGVRAERRAA